MITVDMIPDMVGTWLWHCHVSDHIGAGMLGYYTVADCGNECKSNGDLRSFPRLGAAGFVINRTEDHTDRLISLAALGIAMIALIGCIVLFVCRGKERDPGFECSSVQMQGEKENLV